MKFDPYPEDADVHDSFATVPLDHADGADDGDDSTTQPDAPGPVRRLLERVKTRG